MKKILSKLKVLIPGDWDPHLTQLLKLFVIVLLLTLFARGTAGNAAAKVTVVFPESRTLSEEVFTFGTLSPRGTEPYIIPDGLVITEVLAQVGDSLAPGSPLAAVDPQALDELLTRQEAQLRQMEMQYEALMDDCAPSDDAVRQAQKLLSNAKELRDDLKSGLATALEAVTSAQEQLALAAEEDKESIEAALEQAKNDAASLRSQLDDAEEAVDDATDTLARARADYSDALEQANRDQQSNEAAASVLMLDIEKASEYVSALIAVRDDDYRIVTSGTGDLASLPFVPGDLTQGHSFMLSNPYAGLTLSFRIPKEDAQYLTPATRVSISREKETLELTGCGADPETDDPQQVPFTALVRNETWESGPVNVQVLLWEEQYPTCVPVTALRQDSRGYYVFVLEQKANLWGVEQTVSRVDVQVVRLDAAYAAVSGSLNKGAQVILNSSKPLTEGSRVRVTP